MALLRLETDGRLNFEKHISAICHNVTGQLNALGCVWSFLDNDKKIAITNTSIYRKVNYCPLIWHICSNNSISKLENIPKRTLLGVFLDDFGSDYETLLKKSGKCTIKVRRSISLDLDLYFFLLTKHLNPSYLQKIFIKRNQTKRHKNYFQIPWRSNVTFGEKNLRASGTDIWNQ